MTWYFLTSASLLFTTLAFFVVVCWSAIVVVTAISDDDCFRVRKPAALKIPTSFVVPHFVSLSSLSSCSINSIIGGESRRRRGHQPSDVPPRYGSEIQRRRHYRLFSMGSGDQGNNNAFNADDEPNQFGRQESNENNNMVVIDELSWRVAKVQLEEANTKRFLNRRPLKMSYLQSRQFIQRNWGPVRTRKEFDDLVSNGDLKTPYISKRPEEYYGRRGEWISWEHYLLGECSSSSSNSGYSICNTVSSDIIRDESYGHGRKNSTDTDASSGWRQDVVLKWQ